VPQARKLTSLSLVSESIAAIRSQASSAAESQPQRKVASDWIGGEIAAVDKAL
jgi:hypothetical protein